MEILITAEEGKVINQKYLRKIDFMEFDGSIEIMYFLIANKNEDEDERYICEQFCINGEVNPTFAEELFREILINECTKDVIDMREVKKLYKHRERLEVEKD